jgi:hypothetical protein
MLPPTPNLSPWLMRSSQPAAHAAAAGTAERSLWLWLAMALELIRDLRGLFML